MAQDDAEGDDMEIYENKTTNTSLQLVPSSSARIIDSPEKIQEKKRQRKDGASIGAVKEVVKQLSLSASSLKEGRREQ